MSDAWYPRVLEPSIAHWVRESKMGLLLLGARQTGKSSLLARALAGVESAIRATYASPETLLEHRTDLGAFRAEILEASRRARGIGLIVLIDEAPRNPAIFDLAQDLMDSHPGKIRFALTGSSARQLQAGSYNRLPGRVQIHELWPLSLLEHECAIPDALIWGMLPGVHRNPRERDAILASYGGLYVREEIEQENLVRSPEVFSRFLKLAASESGGLLNSAKLATQLGLDPKTSKRFHEILVATRVAFFLPAFTMGHDRREAILAPKFYFFDNGVRNVLAGRPLSRKLLSVEAGLLFEHQIVQEAIRIASYLAGPANPVRLHYWRDHGGHEIDLVIEDGLGEVRLVEVKHLEGARHDPERLVRGFAAFERDRVRASRVRDRLVVVPQGPRREIRSGRIRARMIGAIEFLRELREWPGMKRTGRPTTERGPIDRR